MKNISRFITIATPFGLAIASFFVGVQKATVDNSWGLIFIAGLLLTAGGILSAHFMIADWDDNRG